LAQQTQVSPLLGGRRPPVLFTVIMPVVAKRRTFGGVRYVDRPMKRFNAGSNKGSANKLSTKTYFRSRIGKGSVRGQIKALQRFVNATASEIKFFDIITDMVNVTLPGSFVHLTSINQGTTDITRVGDNVQVKSISVKGKLNSEAYAGFAPDTVMRMALVQWKNQTPNDSVIAITDIFNPSQTYQLEINPASMGHYKVHWLSEPIYPRRYQQGAGFVPTVTPVIDKVFKVNITVRWNGTSGTSISNNGLYLLLMTSDTTGSGIIDWVGNTRIGFIDN